MLQNVLHFHRPIPISVVTGLFGAGSPDCEVVSPL